MGANVQSNTTVGLAQATGLLAVRRAETANMVVDQYRKQGVKEVIETFPQVGEILDRYGIGCVSCSVGTCLLEDVVRIHGLPAPQEAALMADIERALGSGSMMAAPEPAVAAASPPIGRPARSYSPPVSKLVEEHTWIKRVLAVIPALTEDIRARGRADARLIGEVLDFIRGFADRFHHMKEEDILFDYTDRQTEVVRVFEEEHDQGRGFVRAAARALEDGNAAALCANLTSYRELLVEHIRKEDEILYPYIDRGLTTHQVGEIHRRFEETERAVKADIPERYYRFVTSLERRYPGEEKEQCPTATTTQVVQAPA